MKRARWAGLFLGFLPFLAGCGDFWQAPSNTSFSLSNGGNITIAPAATSGNTSVITVTPANSFTGTVDLTCSVSAPTNATSPATCSFSSSSVDITSTSALTSTLTVTTTSSTTTGAYTITVTGTSGSVAASTSVCAEVSTSSSATCSSTAGKSGIFYVLNSSSITGYTATSSALTSVSGTSYTLSGATAIAIAPSGGFLYVASQSSGIVLYTINSSTGALTQGSSGIGDTSAYALQIDPTGKWLLDASSGGTLTAYPITSAGISDSSRTLQQVSLAGTAVQQMAVSANGALISVALGSTGTQSFTFTASSGTPIGNAYSPTTKPYGSGGAAISVAIDPQSRLLYIGETAAFPNSNSNSGALRVFSISGNSLNELSYSQPYAPLGTGPHAILPDAAGKYVYAASWQSNAVGAITGYSVATSALTQVGSSVDTGTEPNGLAEDSTGSYVLAISYEGGPLFNAYTFDGSTSGQLDTSTTSSSIASNPIAIVAIPK